MGKSKISLSNLANTRASCVDLANLHSDTSSIASTCSAYQFNNGVEELHETDEFAARVEALFEKRGSTREKALESLVVQLRVEHKPEECLQHQDTLISRCTMALRKGGPVESALAATLLGLQVLTVGEQDEGLLISLLPELERTAREGPPPVASAALEAMAVAAFVAGEDEEVNLDLMARLRTALWRKGVDARVVASAVRAWSLLLTTLSCPLKPRVAEPIMADLAMLLKHSDSEVRSAAGEAAALLYDTSSEALQEEDDDDDDDDDEDEEGEEADDAEAGNGAGRTNGAIGHANGHGHSDAGGSAADGLDSRLGSQALREEEEEEEAEEDGHGGDGDDEALEGGMDAVVSLMRGLAANHKGEGPRRRRRDRAALRATFRGLVSSFGPGAAAPVTRVKLQFGSQVVVEGLAKTVQLDFLRRFLAGGFQTHMQHNPFLHTLFDFKPRATKAEKMSAAEKRAAHKASEAAARSRQSYRRSERSAKGGSMMDGY